MRMTQKIKNSNLYKEIISDKNLFNAIYSLESYVFEKELLDDENINLYNNLGDKYNDELTDKIIRTCRKEIEELLEDRDRFFDIAVFFKPKKINTTNSEVEFRPIHTADLKTQICIVAMLTPLIFDDSSGQRILSELSRLLPSNFFGNIPSTDIVHLFKPWHLQYKNYSEDAIKAQKEYSDTKKYLNEVNLDIKQFFPSVNPKWIYNLILSRHPVNYKEDDIECLKVVLEKLLFFNLSISDDSLDTYYPKGNVSKIKEKQSYHNRGIVQGLPQAYFFGNLCMTLISKEIEQIFSGDAYYYVDDSIIYTNSKVEDFNRNIKQLNYNIKETLDSLSTREFENSTINKFIDKITYGISIHDNGNKSSIVNIKPDFSLFLFSRPASSTSFEIFASLDELEDISIKKKIESILSFIDYRLSIIANTNSDNKKLLQRYRKFYTNKLNILKIREDNEVDVNEFYQKYGLNVNTDIVKFMDALDDDVFSVESRLFIKQLATNKKKQYEFINKLKDFETKIHEGKIEHYFSKMLNGQAKFIELKDKKYESIEKKTEKNIISFERLKARKIVETVEATIKSITTSRDENKKNSGQK